MKTKQKKHKADVTDEELDGWVRQLQRADLPVHERLHVEQRLYDGLYPRFLGLARNRGYLRFTGEAEAEDLLSVVMAKVFAVLIAKYDPEKGKVWHLAVIVALREMASWWRLMHYGHLPSSHVRFPSSLDAPNDDGETRADALIDPRDPHRRAEQADELVKAINDMELHVGLSLMERRILRLLWKCNCRWPHVIAEYERLYGACDYRQIDNAVLRLRGKAERSQCVTRKLQKDRARKLGKGNK